MKSSNKTNGEECVSSKEEKNQDSKVSNNSDRNGTTNSDVQEDAFIGYNEITLNEHQEDSNENGIKSINADSNQQQDEVLNNLDSLKKVADSTAVKDLGVPKFLVNKWLNIQNGKSKFAEINCQIDNKDDVSVYSETTQSIISAKIKPRFINQKKESMKIDAIGDIFNNFERRDRSQTIKKTKAIEKVLENTFKVINEFGQSIDASEQSRGEEEASCSQRSSRMITQNDDNLANLNSQRSNNLNLSEKSVGLDRYGSSKDNGQMLNQFSNKLCL